jgi:DNA modification methylase
LEVVSDLIVCADFLEWAASYTGPKFDVIHADFPWGKDYSGPRTRKTGKATINPQYADDPDIYFGLVEGFLAAQDNFAFKAAHCLFWFDMRYYAWTIEQFLKAGWSLVSDYPYLWTKGYSGIASDVKRRPRHCYETALMFSRGDRKIVKLDKDHFDAAIDEKLHLNQKPIAMLKHFLSIFVDEHTAVLDPTCGSGSALAAAKLLGAARVLGIELDSNNADVAKFMLQRHVPTEGEADAETASQA